MSYDPSDERMESLMNDIVRTFDQCAPRLKKRLFTGLMDDIAIRSVLLEENGVNICDEDFRKYREEHWGKVEEMRFRQAQKLLYSLMSEELA